VLETTCFSENFYIQLIDNLVNMGQNKEW